MFALDLVILHVIVYIILTNNAKMYIFQNQMIFTMCISSRSTRSLIVVRKHSNVRTVEKTYVISPRSVFVLHTVKLDRLVH